MSSVPANVQNQASMGMIEKPAYIQEQGQEDNRDLRQFMSPPRLKVVQDQSGPIFKERGFKGGDVILLPSMQKIGDMDTEFTFVTLHVFPTWVILNPWKMKDTLKYIRESSNDPNSDIAIKARAFVELPCPENPKYLIKYKSVQNHMIRIILPENSGIDLPDLPIAMPLLSGEYASGQNLIQLVDSRQSKRYLCQFNAISKYRTGKEGNWYGLDFRNSPTPWIAEHLIPQFKAESETIRKMVSKGEIQVDLNDQDTGPGKEDAASESKF